MGFGIMFLGCCFMLLGAFTALAPFTYVLGSAIVLYSLKELIKQNRLFLVSMIAVATEFLISMVNVFLHVLSENTAISSTFSQILSIVNFAVCVLLVTSIYLLAREVELPSLQRKIIVTYIFMGIYLVCAVLGNTVFKNNEFASLRMVVIISFAQLVYVVLVLVDVANSYMRICYEDDKEMNKKTGVGAMDFLNDKFNKALTPKEKKNKDDKEGGEK